MGGGTGIENPSSLDSEEVIPTFKKKELGKIQEILRM